MQSFHFNGVKNAKIKGISLVNAMGFHMHVTNSYLFRAHSLTITAPPDSPNTDGMHVSKSNTVKIARSVIRTGDDCVSIGPGATNVTINKVTRGPGHGIRCFFGLHESKVVCLMMIGSSCESKSS